MIPFQLHRRIPLVRRLFNQRDYAIAQRDAALIKLGALLRECEKVNGSDTPLSQAPLIQDLKNNYHHLLLACMPKSGSTYLATILANLPNFSNVPLVTYYGKREQEIEPVLLWLNADKNYVAQHHVRCSEATYYLIQTYKLKPIVLVRDIFDVVMSIRDHMRDVSVVSSMAYAFPNFKNWEDEKLEDFIADMVVPWYFNFYVSWLETDEKLLITYNDLNRDPFSVLSRIKTKYGINCSDDEIHEAINKSRTKDQSSMTRKNKAIIGRGQNLSENAREHIYRMARYYDGVDFRPIGLRL
jgi:hypothetical protein